MNQHSSDTNCNECYYEHKPGDCNKKPTDKLDKSNPHAQKLDIKKPIEGTKMGDASPIIANTNAEKLWQAWFKDSQVVGNDPYFIKKDEFVKELEKYVKGYASSYILNKQTDMEGEPETDDRDILHAIAYEKGWNDCRKEMVSRIGERHIRYANRK